MKKFTPRSIQQIREELGKEVADKLQKIEHLYPHADFLTHEELLRLSFVAWRAWEGDLVSDLAAAKGWQISDPRLG